MSDYVEFRRSWRYVWCQVCPVCFARADHDLYNCLFLRLRGLSPLPDSLANYSLSRVRIYRESLA